MKTLVACAAEFGMKPVGMGSSDMYGFVNGMFTTFTSTGNSNFIVSSLLCCAEMAGETPSEETEQKAIKAKEILLSNVEGGDGRIFVTEGSVLSAVIHVRGNKKGVETMHAFLSSALPALSAAGYSGARICADCGQEIPENDVAYYYSGNAVKMMHSECCDRKLSDLEAKSGEESRHANTFLGTMGALIGALAGAALYLLINILGYVASFVGLATGYLTERLYRKMGGKNGWKKFVVLAVALVFSVVLGQTASFAYQVYTEYPDTSFAEDGVSAVEFTTQFVQATLLDRTVEYIGWQYDVAYENLPMIERANVIPRDEFIRELNTQEMQDEAREIRNDFIKDVGMGLLYSLLGGAFFIYRNSRSDFKCAKKLADA